MACDIILYVDLLGRFFGTTIGGLSLRRIRHQLADSSPENGRKKFKLKINSSMPIKREDWKNGNWKDWTEEVEANCWAHQLQQETDGQHMWKCFLNIIKMANQRHIPMITISVHSKPYWNSELSDLSKLISDARDKFKMRATPRNRSTLEDLTTRFKTVLIESKNLWIRERLEGMNITDSTQLIIIIIIIAIFVNRPIAKSL